MRHCTNDVTAHVNHSSHKIWLYCHRCKAHDEVPISQHSLAELAAARGAIEDKLARSVEMPTGTKPIREAPHQALVWLLKGGVSPEYADNHGFRWHEGLEKVLIGIRDEHGKYWGTLARAVDGTTPKYRMLNGQPKFHMPLRINAPIVLTEDVLSAIAYTRAGYCGVAILGTSLDALSAVRLTKGLSNEVLISMDPDRAGMLAVGKVRKAFGLSDVTVGVIRPRLDPKYLPRQELRTLVQEQLNKDA